MNPPSNSRPLITVVIPALNEQDHIGQCLAALFDQTFPREQYQVIVVDNGSVDRTCEIVTQAGARLLHESRRSAYWARNRAIENSDSTWLAFTDADCFPDPHWLSNLHQCAKRNNAWIVGGLTKYDIRCDNLGNRLLCETHQPSQLRQTIETHHCVAGGNLFVRREAFEQLGLFRVIESGSDIELSKRLSQAGFPSFFAEDAVVRHQCDLSNWDYLRRTYRIRKGQRRHSGQPCGVRPAIQQLRKLPWRPGIHAVGADSKPARTSTQWIAEWAYRWANRWAGFLGEFNASIRPAVSLDAPTRIDPAGAHKTHPSPAHEFRIPVAAGESSGH
ncbi:glycosyltransferase [Roseiconus nitratireducens]|uniref:Glycosyltransferase n=1 Tax=Roseiconus nitratireducens TaxID=2605748 RepID=A0A5M6D8D7_9BACT|nr:glycosyltransferase [Roseiconus nitratireducens]KAA5543818.1 glycosyltransferase [Roseiconus nitratireducens]